MVYSRGVQTFFHWGNTETGKVKRPVGQHRGCPLTGCARLLSLFFSCFFFFFKEFTNFTVKHTTHDSNIRLCDLNKKGDTEVNITWYNKSRADQAVLDFARFRLLQKKQKHQLYDSYVQTKRSKQIKSVYETASCYLVIVAAFHVKCQHADRQC